jgi:osmotically-inducible protein OsmY
MEAQKSLAPAAQAALRQSPVPALRNVEVFECEGRIILSGKLRSYYLKQLAQEAVLQVVSNAPVDNQIRVEKT